MRIRVIKAPPVGAVCAPALPEGGCGQGLLSPDPPGLLWRRRREAQPGPPGSARPCRGSARRAGLGWAGLGRAGPCRAGGRAAGAQSARRGGSGALSAAAAERGQSPPGTAPSIPAPGTGPGSVTGTPPTHTFLSFFPSFLYRLPFAAPPAVPPPPSPGHVDAAVVWVHAGAGRLRVRGAAARGEPGEAGPVPVVPAGLRPPAQERERPQGQGGGGFPPGQLSRALQDPGEPPVLAPQPPQAAAALAQGALRGSREAAGQTPGSRGQVPSPPKIPLAPHHLGRRGDQLLLQGEVPGRAAGVVRAQPLPLSAGEAGAGRSHRPHHHPGQQLVQEPEAAGPSGRGEGKGEHGELQRRHQQTQPALAPGREQTPPVQLRGRVFSAAEPRSELGPALAGEPRARQELQLPPERLGRPPERSQPAGPPAPGLAAGTPHVQPGGPGLLKGRHGTGGFARGHGLSVVLSGQPPVSQLALLT